MKLLTVLAIAVLSAGCNQEPQDLAIRNVEIWVRHFEREGYDFRKINYQLSTEFGWRRYVTGTNSYKWVNSRGVAMHVDFDVYNMPTNFRVGWNIR